MKNQILNIGTLLSRSEQKSIAGGNTLDEAPGEGTVRCRCNGFDLGVSESRSACNAACYRCVNSGACAA